jgi:hypothetical protein
VVEIWLLKLLLEKGLVIFNKIENWFLREILKMDSDSLKKLFPGKKFFCEL